MINSFAFNPNPRVHKPNLVRNGNSTGNVRRINMNNSNDERGVSRYQRVITSQNSGQVVDYTVSKSNRVKSLIKKDTSIYKG